MKRTFILILYLFLTFILAIPLMAQSCIESSCDPSIQFSEWNTYYPATIEVGDTSRLYITQEILDGIIGCSGVPDSAYRIQVSFPNSYSLVEVDAQEFDLQYHEIDRTLTLWSHPQNLGDQNDILITVVGEFVTEANDITTINIQITPPFLSGSCPAVFGNDISNDVLQPTLKVTQGSVNQTLIAGWQSSFNCDDFSDVPTGIDLRGMEVLPGVTVYGSHRVNAANGLDMLSDPDMAIDRVLIFLQEDGIPMSVPNDRGGGGWIAFVYDEPRKFLSASYMDLDGLESLEAEFHEDNMFLVSSGQIPAAGDGQITVIHADDIITPNSFDSLVYIFDSSGGIIEQCFTTQLSLDLISFTGTNKGSYVDLEWITANEIETLGFEVEHSTGRNFELIGRTSGYTMRHENPSEVNYYRLFEIEESGSRIELETIVIYGTVDSEYQVYNMLGQYVGNEIERLEPGMYLKRYENGSSEKVIKLNEF